MYIYKTTNLINNKIYIGLSTKTIKESTRYYGSGILLNKAIKKYGKENFTKEIIDIATSLKDLKKLEIFWIKKYNSTDRAVGYNITPGGMGGDTLSKHPNLNEISKKISKSNSAKWEDEKFRAKMSKIRKKIWKDETYRSKLVESRKGHPAYPNQIQATKDTWTGRKHKLESIEKIRKKQTGKKYSDEVNKSKGRPGAKWYRNPQTGETIMSIKELNAPWIRGRGKLK